MAYVEYEEYRRWRESVERAAQQKQVIYGVGIPSPILDECHARQIGLKWCWAAVIETILAYHGFRAPQEQTVERVFGKNAAGQLPDAPATLGIIERYLNGMGHKEDGLLYEVGCRAWDGYSPDDGTAIAELGAQRPFLLAYGEGGKVGHVVVCTGAIVQAGKVLGYFVRDPMQGGPGGRRLLTAAERGSIRGFALLEVRPYVEKF